MRWTPIILALALALTLAPGASAQAAGPGETAKVTFYGHVFGLGLAAPMPANDQPPEGEEVFGLGTTDVCTPVANTDQGTTGCDADTQNKLALFSSAGFVDVKGRDEFNSKGDYTLFHNERGLTKDVVFDMNEDVTASIWMSLDSHIWFVGGGNNETDCAYNNPRDVGCLYPYWGWDPAVWPDWQVKATLYAANLGDHGSSPSEAPPIAEAIAAGDARVIASGETTPMQVVNGLPGNPNVHQFVVNLGKPQSETVSREESFFLVFSWNTDTAGNEYSIHNWRVWAGEFFPPVFTLPVKNAFEVEAVVPNFLHEKLVIVGVMNTPWGSYDVDPAMTRLTVAEKGTGREVVPFRLDTFDDYSVAHGGHYRPVNQTWIWDYARDDLPPGTYTVTVTATNWAHSAYGACMGEFTVLEGGRPGPVSAGRCGQATADDAFLEEVANLGGGAPASGGADDGDSPTVLGLPQVGLLGVGVVLARRWRA